MIVSSVLTRDLAQADGRFWAREDHTDHLGLVYGYGYLAAEGLDADAVMAARVASIDAQLTAGEIAANVASVMALGSTFSPTFNYSTANANQLALRAAYQTSTQLQAVMIGDFLSGLSNAVLQALFSLTAGQVTTLRSARLTPAANTATAIRAAAGQ